MIYNIVYACVKVDNHQLRIYCRVNRRTNSLLEHGNGGQGGSDECRPPRTHPVSAVQPQVHDASLRLYQHGQYLVLYKTQIMYIL